MILNKERKPKKEVLLEELAKEDLQVLSLAYVYAKNLQMYGEDVTKVVCSATENTAMLEKAYRKGYHDAMMLESENWEHMKRLIDAVTMGAFAIARLNEIDYGKAESELPT